MNVGEFLSSKTQTLHDAGIQTARLDTLILLEDALGRDRAALLAHLELPIDQPTEVALNNKIAQRATHTPLAYIRGKAPFYGRDFIVDPRVLVPRPETEAMIDTLKSLPLPSHPRIADIGAGSGCIGITAALEIPGARVDLYDIDAGALQVARSNAHAHNTSTHCYKGDLLGHPAQMYDIVLANPPYVPDAYDINQAATHEPKLALFAGSDGLDLYQRLWQQIAGLAQKPAFVLTEALPQQHPALAQLAMRAGYHLHQTQDFIQAFKLD